QRGHRGEIRPYELEDRAALARTKSSNIEAVHDQISVGVERHARSAAKWAADNRTDLAAGAVKDLDGVRIRVAKQADKQPIVGRIVQHAGRPRGKSKIQKHWTARRCAFRCASDGIVSQYFARSL